MPIPAGNFGNPGAADVDEWNWGPLLIGFAGLAFMYFMGKAQGKAQAQGVQGLGRLSNCGPRCGCQPCQQQRW